MTYTVYYGYQYMFVGLGRIGRKKDGFIKHESYTCLDELIEIYKKEGWKYLHKQKPQYPDYHKQPNLNWTLGYFEHY